MDISSIFIHVPAHHLPERLPLLLDEHRQPEVACQEVAIEKLYFEHLGFCAQHLTHQGLRTTLHAPFSGFNPGSTKRRTRKLSHDLADKSLQLAESLKAQRIIFHPGLKYGTEGKVLDYWVTACRDFWPEFIERAQAFDCIICIENIYEQTPDPLIRLLSAIDSDYLGHVFDVGHWNIFSSTKLEDWLQQTAPFLRHLHLHDNHGSRDEHLALGEGNIDFPTLFNWIRRNNPERLTYTIENRNFPQTEQSLKYLGAHLRAQ
ncbi:MAG: AP endonuclease [Desulfuromonas sp.]|nr:MAG: AP endonuclease [Desulfuromonas sp.]